MNLPERTVYYDGGGHAIVLRSNGDWLMAVPVKPGYDGAAFGNLYHMLKLLANRYAKPEHFTEFGLETFAGLHSHLIVDSFGVVHGSLTFPKRK